MFSSTAEYALRAVVYLATNRSGLWSSRAIAEGTKVPPQYISKVLNDLVTADLVTSRRGPHGGFALARDPERIAVLDVVNAVDPIRRIETCPLGIPTHGRNLCRLHRKLDDTIALVEEALRSASITEMTEPSRAGSKCLFPTIGGVQARTRGRARPGPAA
jgi:Rrf2 family transcriptional regulator, nitric oxide-sensitive transcriptional repressor